MRSREELRKLLDESTSVEDDSRRKLYTDAAMAGRYTDVLVTEEIGVAVECSEGAFVMAAVLVPKREGYPKADREYEIGDRIVARKLSHMLATPPKSGTGGMVKGVSYPHYPDKRFVQLIVDWDDNTYGTVILPDDEIEPEDEE